jgi:hypothetical protein
MRLKRDAITEQREEKGKSRRLHCDAGFFRLCTSSIYVAGYSLSAAAYVDLWTAMDARWEFNVKRGQSIRLAHLRSHKVP